MMGIITSLFSQKEPLDYFLPATSYDASIPSPESYLGYQVGEWHVSHDQLVGYLKTLAASSPRVELEEYARSHENRPLVVLKITSEKNQSKLEEIREQHLAHCDPNASPKVSLDQLPAIVYQGYSIHGNESSGANAALLVAYHLVAGQGEKIEKLLEEVVVLLDPCFNPDGLHRFSTWVNMHKSKNLVSDPYSREFSETWPGGRTNHYWFDLNRDWLLLTHPESQGRIRIFHQWKPNILTDHHEMGSNSTFFFQPGVASRTNPLTPPRNQELTREIGKFHAKALDDIGSLYYSEESFDDFYYGKGSTYPDVNACIGILFEQASSRGHLKETENGLMGFPFTIRNQVRTSLSTLESAQVLKNDLLTYQRKFYTSAQKEAKADEDKGFIFSSKDQNKLSRFIHLLLQHQIKVFPTEKDKFFAGQRFSKENSYLVPCDQSQYRMVKAIFNTQESFTDSIFYDVSTWTLPLAFDLHYEALDASDFAAAISKNALENTPVPTGEILEKESGTAYGYLLPWEDYFAPKALYQIYDQDLRAKLATKDFSMNLGGESHFFKAGTIFIPVQNQSKTPQEMAELMASVTKDCGLEIHKITSGKTSEGIDLGSPSFFNLKKPEILMIVGDGVSSYDAGEVWHLLDTRYDVPLSMIEGERIGRLDLDRYTCIVLADGSYGRITKGGVDELKKWVRGGGTLVALERAVEWAILNDLSYAKLKKAPKAKKNKERRPYDRIGNDRGADVIGGAIFQTRMDLSHPLCFGFEDDQLPLFRQGTLFMDLPKNPYASPLIYAEKPYLSGYVSDKNLGRFKDAAAVVVSRIGRGRSICLTDNPNFRGFWYGSNKLFANALFFGGAISGRSGEGAEEEEDEEEEGHQH